MVEPREGMDCRGRTSIELILKQPRYRSFIASNRTVLENKLTKTEEIIFRVKWLLTCTIYYIKLLLTIVELLFSLNCFALV